MRAALLDCYKGCLQRLGYHLAAENLWRSNIAALAAK
jgi:hypothetical protein